MEASHIAAPGLPNHEKASMFLAHAHTIQSDETSKTLPQGLKDISRMFSARCLVVTGPGALGID